MRTQRRRECAHCSVLYDEPCPWPHPWPRRFCSEVCHKDFKRAEAPALRRTTALVTRAPVKQERRALSIVSTDQRDAVAMKACVVCREWPVDPAHLIPAGMCPDGDGDPRAVVPLCRRHHDEYDRDRTLDLLPFLEPHFRDELAFAVQRFGLAATYRRVTNERQSMQSSERTT